MHISSLRAIIIIIIIFFLPKEDGFLEFLNIETGLQHIDLMDLV